MKKDVKVKSVAKKGYFDDRVKAILALHEEKMKKQKGGKG
jgi:hypothetical protein